MTVGVSRKPNTSMSGMPSRGDSPGAIGTTLHARHAGIPSGGGTHAFSARVCAPLPPPPPSPRLHPHVRLRCALSRAYRSGGALKSKPAPPPPPPPAAAGPPLPGAPRALGGACFHPPCGERLHTWARHARGSMHVRRACVRGAAVRCVSCACLACMHAHCMRVLKTASTAQTWTLPAASR